MAGLVFLFWILSLPLIGLVSTGFFSIPSLLSRSASSSLPQFPKTLPPCISVSLFTQSNWRFIKKGEKEKRKKKDNVGRWNSCRTHYDIEQGQIYCILEGTRSALSWGCRSTAHEGCAPPAFWGWGTRGGWFLPWVPSTPSQNGLKCIAKRPGINTQI